jgi:hypothetical protein
MDIPALAEAYVRREPQGDSEKAENELHRMLREDPEDAWDFIIAAIDAARSVDDLGFIGAGPIEDMLRFWGGRFNDDLIARARVDPRWGYAARMVQGTPGAQEAADAAGVAWPDFQSLTLLAGEALREG